MNFMIPVALFQKFTTVINITNMTRCSGKKLISCDTFNPHGVACGMPPSNSCDSVVNFTDWRKCKCDGLCRF